MEQSAHFPSDGVLMELGRLVYAAVELERSVFRVGRIIEPTDVTGREPNIGTEIERCMAVLEPKPDCDLRTRSMEWLERCAAALSERNAVVHSEPCVDYGGDPPRPLGPVYLVHFPRDRTKPTVHTPLTTEALEPIRRRLEDLGRTWADIARPLSVWEHR